MSCPACPAWPDNRSTTALRALLLRLVALLLLLAPLPPALAASFYVNASSTTAAAYPWIDISTTGTGLNLGDDGISATLTLGFSFNFGSATHTGVRIMSNGQVQFGGTDTSYTPSALPLDGNSGKPNIDAVMMPLWVDLNPSSGQIRWARQGTAPNRVFIASWNAVPFYDGSGTATFQVQIHEQGFFVYRYQAVAGSGANALVGMETSDTDFVQHALNSASVPTGTTLLWSRTPPTAAYAYLFNEAFWTGAPGEVLDAGASARHGTAAGLLSPATTATASPAVSGTTGTCGYGVFSRSDKQHVLLPITTPNASGSTFSLTTWIRSTDPSLSGQRVIVDDDTRTGWAVSLGDGGTGRLRFYGRGAALTLDTANVIAANVWYFITLTVNAATKQVALKVYSATGALLGSASGTYTSGGIGADTGRTTIGGNSNAALDNTSSVGFAGLIDELRGFGSVLSTADQHAVRQLGTTCPPPPLSFPAYLTATGVPVGGFSNTAPTAALANHDPWRDGEAGLLLQKGASGVDESDSTKIQRWVSGTGGVLLGGGLTLTLWSAMKDFRTDKAGSLGITLRDCNAARSSCTTLASVNHNRGPWASASGWVQDVIQIGALAAPVASGRVLELSVVVTNASEDDMLLAYDSVGQPSALGIGAAAGPARMRIEHASGAGLTCTPSTLTVLACQDEACATPYTGGVSGLLSASGGSVNWPDGSSFNIAAGSSSTTVRVQVSTTTAALLGATAASPPANSSTTCNFGSPACTFTAADSGFLFNVPNHVSEVAQTVTVSAVRKSDNATVCTPAFASTSKTVTFTCGYTSPTSGTLPVRVGGTPLNATGVSALACDTSGRGVSLSFNASGVASTTVQYADVGQMLLSARFEGAAGGSEAGLVMTGSDSFIAAPDHFTIDSVTAGPIRAGSTFSATVTARNSAGATTPNHGREAAAQRAGIGWLKRQPNGGGAVAGSFSGTGLRSFTNGAVTASDLSWTEVGRGDLVVRGSDNAGYLGSGLHVFGSSVGSGARTCAAENASCVLPGGVTATVYYGALEGWTAKGAQTGTVACSNANFGDPAVGRQKRCYYVADATSSGSVGDFIPHRFSVAAPNACGAFTYAAQPVTATVTALNTAGNPTRNFNGTATTTPVFAQAVTLSDANALGLGTLSGASIAASAFSAGVATSQVGYAFTSKATAPQSLLLRADNGLSGAAQVSSAGGTEATLALRSGRLRLANAFGSAAAALQVPAVTEYWSGNAWLLNSADSCTALAGASVALSNPRSATGGVSSATTSAGALAISSGSGSITLAAPSPVRSSLSLDLAVNLGSTGADQSCHSAHPATTGAALPWLRAQNGNCATSADRDPAARASFGIFSPETRRTVHVRELF